MDSSMMMDRLLQKYCMLRQSHLICVSVQQWGQYTKMHTQKWAGTLGSRGLCCNQCSSKSVWKVQGDIFPSPQVILQLGSRKPCEGLPISGTGLWYGRGSFHQLAPSRAWSSPCSAFLPSPTQKLPKCPPGSFSQPLCCLAQPYQCLPVLGQDVALGGIWVSTASSQIVVNVRHIATLWAGKGHLLWLKLYVGLCCEFSISMFNFKSRMGGIQATALCMLNKEGL